MMSHFLGGSNGERECDRKPGCPVVGGCSGDRCQIDLLGRLQGVMEAMPDMVFEIDSNGTHLFVHAQPGQTPIHPSEMVGLTVSQVLPPALSDLVMTHVQEALRTGKPQRFTYQVPDPEGDVRHYQTSMGVSPNDTVVTIVRNVTDETRKSDRLERKQRELEEANRTLNHLIYVVSHDLREPLTGISGFASLVSRRYSKKLGVNGQQFLTEIVDGCRRLERKLDDLLTLSKIGSKRPRGSFKLTDAILEAKRALRGTMEEKRATVHVPMDLPRVLGDQSMIAQVFQNLFSNSLKYNDVCVNVWVDAKVTERECVVSVKDNGIGFDMKHANRVFDVFQRLHSEDQYPGTGIGLAIVKKIVERHGGTVWVDSTPGRGTIFFFTLSAAPRDK